MKIAVLSSHTPSLFWFRMDMMKSFIERGHEVFALGNEDESLWKDKFNESGICYRQIKVQRNGTNPFNDIFTLASIVSELKKINPDKMFTYQAKTVIYGGIAARILGIKDVYPMIAGIGSVFLNNDFKTKIIRSFLVSEYKIGMKKSANVFFQNNDDKEVFMKYGIIKNQKITMINGSGVNIDKFHEMPMPEKFTFLCISRLIKDKGVFEYLEAGRAVKKQYPSVRFMLVGPFDSNPSALSKEELDEYIKDGTVEFFGEQKDVLPFLEQASVFVLPSYREGTPKTNLEAMACGRAVITTDAPGCRQTIVAGENGFLVPVKDVKALSDKMIYLINNEQEAHEMGRKGRKIAEELFDVNKVNNVICKTMRL